MPGHFTLKQGERDRKWYFNFEADNSEIVLQSKEYSSKASAAAGIQSVRNNCENDSRYERQQYDKGCWFVLRAANGRAIGKSEMYPTNVALDKGIEFVKANGTCAVIK